MVCESYFSNCQSSVCDFDWPDIWYQNMEFMQLFFRDSANATQIPSVTLLHMNGVGRHSGAVVGIALLTPFIFYFISPTAFVMDLSHAL